MKDFISKIFFGIFALIVIVFLIIMFYKTLTKADIIEKSKYEDKVNEKVNETIDTAKKEVIDAKNKILNKEEIILDESGAVEVRVVAEKSYSNINRVYSDLSTYSGYFIGSDGNIYAFFITGNSEFGTMPIDERSRLMVVNSKRIDNMIQSDLEDIKRLVRRIAISYDELPNEQYEEENYAKTKMMAVYDYKRNERISIREEGKYFVNNNSEDAEKLEYLIGKYITYYKITYDEYNNIK